MVTLSLVKIEAYETAYLLALAADNPRFNFSNARTVITVLGKVKKVLKKHKDKQYIESNIEKIYAKFPSLRPKKRGGK